MVDIRSETNLEVVRQVALLLDSENARLINRLKSLAEEIDQLRGRSPRRLELELSNLQEMMATRNRALFGKSSEKRDAPEARSGESAEAPPQKGHGPTEQPRLPVIEKIHSIPEEERVCPACGGAMEPMGGQCEESEEVTVLPRGFVVVRHKREKYRCRCMETVVTAPGPPKLIPGGRYSPEFAVEVAVAKYADHMPLERQSRIMGREGLDAGSQALWNQIEAMARHLKPSYEAVIRMVLESPVVLADETHWQMMGKSGSCRWWAWCAAAEREVFYKILDSRSSNAAKEVLGGYEGIVMADAYSVYENLARGSPGFTLAHCWAHVRRKFVEAEPHYPQECAEVLDLIGALYAVERVAPKLGPGASEEQAEARAKLLVDLRADRSAKTVGEIRDVAFRIKPSVLPGSSLGKAIDYTLGIWPGLNRFLTDVRIPLDNNGAERAMRGVVIGRKNHYGSRSKRGTEVAALFYTLIETAKLRGAEPKAYLLDATLRAIAVPGTATLPRGPETQPE